MEKTKPLDILQQLKRTILPLEGYKNTSGNTPSIGLPALERAFPNAVFPTGAIHEFHSLSAEAFAATSGFVTAVVFSLR